MSDERSLAEHLQTFAAALARLQDALAQPKSQWTRDAAIQRFEFTVELAWKTIQRVAAREGVECLSPRQAFRVAAQLGWISDVALWLDMLDDRNRSSHTYNESTAELIYSHLAAYATGLDQLLAQLRATVGNQGR